MKFAGLALLSLTLASCADNIIPPAKPAAPRERPAAAIPARPAIDKRGLEAVMGKDATALKRLFGEPRLDVVEVNGRKLQFVGKACVLDTYLYTDRKGGVEIVTYVDARRSDGAEVDRASCVDALQRR
ncbi:MAG: hypothetical protein ABI668_07300 [Sphingorhabdus sp.]